MCPPTGHMFDRTCQGRSTNGGGADEPPRTATAQLVAGRQVIWIATARLRSVAEVLEIGDITFDARRHATVRADEAPVAPVRP